MTLAEFHARLRSHDWFYHYSDDGRVYRAGADSAARLAELSKESEDHSRLYKAFCDAMLHDKPQPLKELRAELGIACI